jgi:hypothetical protein
MKGNIEVTVLDEKLNPLSLFKGSKSANDFAKSLITNKERLSSLSSLLLLYYKLI